MKNLNLFDRLTPEAMLIYESKSEEFQRLIHLILSKEHFFSQLPVSDVNTVMTLLGIPFTYPNYVNLFKMEYLP
jgi:hypothetical protein